MPAQFDRMTPMAGKCLTKTAQKAILLGLISLGLIVLGLNLSRHSDCPDFGSSFDGDRAFQDAAYQMWLGPRAPGSEAHALQIDWMVKSLKDTGWVVDIQKADAEGHPIDNVVAKRGSGRPWLILGAHYDSRLRADQDPNPSMRASPVPGANDGASGVAVLLELARVLPCNYPSQVWIVFFDAEDNGNIEGWHWLLGSRAFADSLKSNPDGVVVVDMIGDADLNIYQEANSDKTLSAEIWQQADRLAYGDVFINSVKYSMLDDHTPFLERGIPVVDIIDFDYTYWHTTHDTLDKISALSLQIVGDTLLNWLLN